MFSEGRVSILGGGPAGITAAWHLSRAGWEVDVYTMGHRLGGKAASGRDEHGRILEHGLHILFGFYENFFRLVRQAYDEADRPPDHPMATWRHAFEPAGPGVLCDGETPVVFQYPSNTATPGDGGRRDLGELALAGVLAALEVAGGWDRLEDHVAPPDRATWRGRGAEPPPAFEPARRGLMKAALALGRGLRVETPLRVLREVGSARTALLDGLDKLPPAWRAPAQLVDLWATLALGLLADGVRDLGDLARLDAEDWDGWLARHGAHASSRRGPWARSVYDAAFSFDQGDPRRPSVGAGSAILGQLLGSFTYKGSCFYKMQTGMGDAVFGPLYEVLRRRGVRFHFFHRVRSLHVDGDRIGAVSLERQVDAPDYEPLVDVDGLACWPEEPLWDQLPPRARGRRLESWWDQGGAPLRLEAGRDYDQLVYALPIGTVPQVCGELIEASPRWAGMVERVRSITTIAVQLWSESTLAELGWTRGEPLLSCFRAPLPTWADMSQVLESEAWTAPRHVSYFCGTQEGPAWAPDPEDDPDFPARENARLWADVPDALRDWGALLPGLVRDGEIAWDRIADPLDRQGPERLGALHVVANCEPHARCTVALPGSTAARLAPGDTGFAGLAIAGDWTANGIHMACVEGAVVSGILAARAVSGDAFPILGPLGRS